MKVAIVFSIFLALELKLVHGTKECDNFLKDVRNGIDEYLHPKPKEKKIGLMATAADIMNDAKAEGFAHSLEEPTKPNPMAEKTDTPFFSSFLMPKHWKSAPLTGEAKSTSAARLGSFKNRNASTSSQLASPATLSLNAQSATSDPNLELISEAEQLPPLEIESPKELTAAKRIQLRAQRASEIIFESLEKQMFISLKSAIQNLVINRKASQEEIKAKNLLTEIALDIAEEFEAKEVALFFDIVNNAMGAEGSIDPKLLLQRCEESRSSVVIFTEAFRSRAVKQFTHVKINPPKVANYLTSSTNYVLDAFDKKASQLHPHSIDAKRAALKKQLLETYIETELSIRIVSDWRKIHLEGRGIFFKINLHKNAVEKFGDNLKSSTLMALSQIWTDIQNMHKRIPIQYHPTEL